MFVSVIISSVLLTLVHCRCSLKNVEVHTILKDNTPLVINVTGCLQRKAFLDGETTRNVVEIDINGQNIPNLRKDDVKHLIHLRKITIRNTNLKGIDVKLFRNTPKLQVVEFTSDKINEIEEGIFDSENFESLSFSINEIALIHDKAFSNMNYLKYLNMSHNKLNVFQGSWFVNLPNLTAIDFGHNEIVTLPQKAFANIPNTTEIYLGHNNIISIEPKAFEGLLMLKLLDLKYNLLRTVNENSFPPKFGIDAFYINANRLNFLKMSLIEYLNLNAIGLDGNPWNCFCYLKIESEVLLRGTRILPSKECAGSATPVCTAAYVSTCQEEYNDALTIYYYQQVDPEDNSTCTRHLKY